MGFECSISSCPSYNSCSQIPSVTNRKKEKSIDILFAVSATKQDATNKKPLSSTTGLIFKNAIRYVESELGRTLTKAYVCIIRTSERTNDNLKCCKQNFIQDVKRFNPKLIVAVGQSATASILTDNPYSRDVFLKNKSIFRKISLDGKSYNFLAMTDALKAVEDPSILCGVIEDLRRASGVYDYKPMQEAGNRIVPSTIKEVKEVIQHLMHVKTEAIAVDTEDKNLNRRYGNTLDSVQFCYDPKTSYFIWVSHPKTPFDAYEQKIVKKYLHTLFTRDNKNFKYWVMHNAKFDMTILLSQLKARVYNPVICTMTFPFILEENFVDSITGDYSLKGLSKKFGFKGFGAEELIARSAGRLRNLSSEKFIEYATNDVVATIQLYYILKKMAEGQKTFKYEKKEDGSGIRRIITGNYLEKAMNLMECFYSRVYKLLIEIEHNGIVVDLENLWGLMKADSPINIRMNEILNVDFKKSKAIQDTNQILADSSSMTPSLFDTPWIFDINTVAHKRLLFFDVLKLKPLKAPKMDCPLCKNNINTRSTCTRCRGTGRSKDFDKDGKVTIANRKFTVGSTDRAFQDEYIESCPEIALLDEYSKLKKLQTSYIKSIVKFLDPKNNHKDYYTDLRIRPEFGLMAKTGRARTKNPNSQQIPRGDTPIKKAIKNLFYSPPGYAIVSLDYMAIEVRSWGVISQDKNMAEMFIKAKHHRDLWKKTEDPKEKELATKYGDIHIANASAMYDVSPEKVEKYMRQASKGLTFGSMFGSSMKSMSIGMGCSVEEAEVRRNKAFSKFMEAGKWLDNIEKIAEKDLFVESPLGRRRRLWEFLTNKPGWCNRAKRQARNCVDYKTELLTEKGWKKHNEINIGDLVLTKNLETSMLEWKPIQKIHNYPDYKGEIYNINSKSFSAICTPNHRWPIFNKSTGKNELREMSKVSVYGEHKIHRTGIYCKENTLWTDDEVALIGWVLTDASYKKHPKWNLTSINVGQSKEENKPIIDNIFKNLGINFTKRDEKRKITDKTHTIWNFSRDLAVKIRNALPNRKLTPEFLLSLSSKQLEILCNSIVLGDGWIDSKTKAKRICAEDKYEADMLQMLFTLMGKSASSKWYKPAKEECRIKNTNIVIRPKKGIWLVREHKRNRVQIVKSQLKKEYRKEPIWCITIENSTFVARREGQVYISGNSPIQGFASDITFIGAALMLQELVLKEKRDWSFYNAVHDAIYLYVPLDEVEECVLRSEEFFTDKLFKILEKDFGFHVPFPLEAEFEIGIYGGDLKKWDFSRTQLKEIIKYLYEVDGNRKKEQKTHKLYNFKGF